MRNHIVIWHYFLLVYLVGSVTCGLYFLDASDYIFFAVASLPVMLMSMLLSKGNLIDPRVWFSVFGWLYSFSSAVLAWGGDRNVDVNVSFESAYINYIFYMSTILFLWIFSFLLKKGNVIKDEHVVKDGRWKLGLIVMVLCVFLLTDAAVVFLSGLTSKRMIAEAGVGLPFSGVISNTLFVAYSLYLLASFDKNIKCFIGIVGISLFASYLFTGERDLIAKFALCTSFALIYTGKVRQKVVYVFGLIFVLLFVFMKDMASYVLSRGDYEVSKFDGFKWAIFKGDWSSSGSNLELLLGSKSLIHDMPNRLQFLFNDIVAGILPFGSRLVESTGQWYANNFLYYSIGREVGGLGFSYLGSWYVYFGEIGSLLGAMVYAFIVWLYYYKANNARILMAAYIAFAALAIWSLRVGFHGLLTSAINQTLFPLLLIICFLKYMRFKTR